MVQAAEVTGKARAGEAKEDWARGHDGVCCSACGVALRVGTAEALWVLARE